MMDFIGGLLDNPGRMVGIDPAKIAPQDRNAYRGAILSAAFDSLRTNGPTFTSNLQGISQGMQEREEFEIKRQREIAAQQAQQQLAQLFAGGAAPGQPAGSAAPPVTAPGAAPAPMNNPSAFVAPQPQAAPPAPAANPNKARAEVYRRAAMMVAATNPEAAAKYADIADKLDPRDEYFAPQEAVVDGKPVMIQGGKYGQQRVLPGIAGKGETLPGDVREYQFAVSQGYKGTFEQWDLARRKAASPTNNIEVKTGAAFGTTFAEGVAKQVLASKEAADGAQNTLAAVGQIEQALPQSFTGTGADARVFLARLQSTLGVGGANTEEKLRNTAVLVQGLARTELGAAEAMKGQGQITEGERALIRRAAAGEISMTPGEIAALSGALRKVAQFKIQSHQANVQRLQNVQGVEQFVPFFQGGGAAPAAAPAGAAPNLQDAARQELLRRQGGR